MVRFSEEEWLKASIEYEEGEPCKLGAVVTRAGYSDWSTEDLPTSKALSYSLRLRCNGGDVLVDYRGNAATEWRTIRMAHLCGPQTALTGFYACSPKGAGFRVELESLTIEE